MADFVRTVLETQWQTSRQSLYRKHIPNLALFNNEETITLFIPNIANDLEILTVPTNAQLYCYVFYS